ncbi:MAG TPA: MFS transporter [Solirubrobacteraceae bacterium]|nr:MFS transporter [Solirubrobacteraceae bacterium]
MDAELPVDVPQVVLDLPPRAPLRAEPARSPSARALPCRPAHGIRPLATANAPYYLVAFAAGNLLGPIILGGLFDSVGRRPMIAGTYILSGVLLLATGYMFEQHQWTAATLTACWSVVFFFASAGVSAAYLTVSEIFPLETRALCIALFYAVGTGIGGIIGPQPQRAPT